jgi:hypothetical protein
MDEGLKSPYWPNVEGAGLKFVGLEECAEVLDPGGARNGLGRGPILLLYESCR